MILLKKRYFNSILLVLITVCASAQNDSVKVKSTQPSSFVSVCVGPRILINKDNITGAYDDLYPGLGASMLIQIPVDKKKLDFIAIRIAYGSNKISGFIENGNGALGPQPPSPTEPAYLNVYSAMLGLFITGGDVGRYSIDGRLLVGYRGSNIKGSGGIGSDIGFGLRPYISHKICLNFCIDVESLTFLDVTAGIGYVF